MWHSLRTLRGANLGAGLSVLACIAVSVLVLYRAGENRNIRREIFEAPLRRPVDDFVSSSEWNSINPRVELAALDAIWNDLPAAQLPEALHTAPQQAAACLMRRLVESGSNNPRAYRLLEFLEALGPGADHYDDALLRWVETHDEFTESVFKVLVAHEKHVEALALFQSHFESVLSTNQPKQRTTILAVIRQASRLRFRPAAIVMAEKILTLDTSQPPGSESLESSAPNLRLAVDDELSDVVLGALVALDDPEVNHLLMDVVTRQKAKRVRERLLMAIATRRLPKEGPSKFAIGLHPWITTVIEAPLKHSILEVAAATNLACGIEEMSPSLAGSLKFVRSEINAASANHKRHCQELAIHLGSALAYVANMSSGAEFRRDCEDFATSIIDTTERDGVTLPIPLVKLMFESENLDRRNSLISYFDRLPPAKVLETINGLPDGWNWNVDALQTFWTRYEKSNLASQPVALTARIRVLSMLETNTAHSEEVDQLFERAANSIDPLISTLALKSQISTWLKSSDSLDARAFERLLKYFGSSSKNRRVTDHLFISLVRDVSVCTVPEALIASAIQQSNLSMSAKLGLLALLIKNDSSVATDEVETVLSSLLSNMKSQNDRDQLDVVRHCLSLASNGEKGSALAARFCSRWIAEQAPRNPDVNDLLVQVNNLLSTL